MNIFSFKRMLRFLGFSTLAFALVSTFRHDLTTALLNMLLCFFIIITLKIYKNAV